MDSLVYNKEHITDICSVWPTAVGFWLLRVCSGETLVRE